MVLLLLAVMLASPSPSPTPHLKTIMTVKSSPQCGAFAAHVNAAIGSAVQNDQSLGSAILDLRSNDLEGTVLDRNREENSLSNLASAIYKQYRTGETEVAQLRELAAKASDPDAKAALKASADALGGVLYRQHLIQRDLDGFVAYLNASDMLSDMPSDETYRPDMPVRPAAMSLRTGSAGEYWTPQGYHSTGLTVGEESHEDDVRMAASASADFQSRMPAILQDEMTAGSRIELASVHC